MNTLILSLVLAPIAMLAILLMSGAFVIVKHRRSVTPLTAMTNQAYTGTPTSRRFCLLPASILAGQPILVGKQAGFPLDNYQSNVGGATVLFNGTFFTTVIGQSSESPVVGAKISPGDDLYAVGTLDSATNVTYNLTIDVNTSNTKFGKLDPSATAIGSGVTNTAAPVSISGV